MKAHLLTILTLLGFAGFVWLGLTHLAAWLVLVATIFAGLFYVAIWNLFR